MCDERAELARHMVNVPVFSTHQLETIHLEVLRRQTALSTLLDHPWFEKITVIGKHVWGWGKPIATIYPTGRSEKDPAVISYELMKRWRRHRTMLITCYRASKECHGIFGGKRMKLGVSAAHHIGVASVYIWLATQKAVEGWRLEDSRFLSPRTKRPDAFLGDILIDFGGCYSVRRIWELADIAQDWGRPLQIW